MAKSPIASRGGRESTSRPGSESKSRVDERRAVEMPVVMTDEIGDRAHESGTSGVSSAFQSVEIRKSRRAPQ